jgi:hypothetical protein
MKHEMHESARVHECALRAIGMHSRARNARGAFRPRAFVRASVHRIENLV